MNNIAISFSSGKYSSLLFWNLCKYLTLIDTVNGFCIEYGIPFPIGQIYKFALLFFLVVNLFRFPKGRVIVTFSFIYLLIYINFLLTNTYSQFIAESVILFSKFLIIPLMLFYLFELQKVSNPTWFWNNAVKVLKFNLFFLCANVFSGLIGIGTHSYDESIGYKGFLYAINEISGLGIVLFCFFVYYSNIIYSKKNFIVTCCILIATTILLGTKTLLISLLLALYYLPSITLHSNKKSFRIYRFLIILASLCLLIYGGYTLLNNIGFLDRWIYFYDKGGLEQIIFSGRNLYWLEEKKFFYSSDFLVRLFGLGENRTVEIDPFDILLNFGYIGILLIYSFYISLIVRSFKLRNEYNISKLIFFINLLLMIASSFAGHIIFSGMLGPFVAILNSLVRIPNDVIYKSISHRKV